MKCIDSSGVTYKVHHSTLFSLTSLKFPLFLGFKGEIRLNRFRAAVKSAGPSETYGTCSPQLPLSRYFRKGALEHINLSGDFTVQRNGLW